LAIINEELITKNNQPPDPPAEIIINLEDNNEENIMDAITRTQMISTAKQMNVIFSYEPEEMINLKAATKNGLTDEQLKATIVNNGAQLEASDFEFDDNDENFVPFDDDAKAVFTALGVLIPLKPAPVVKDEKGKVVKTTAKTKSEVKYTRANAFADAVKSGETNLEKLLTVADKLFMKANNKPTNIKEAKWYQSTVVPGLIALDLYTIVNDCLIKTDTVIPEPETKLAAE